MDAIAADPLCLYDGQELTPEAEEQIVSIALLTDEAGGVAGDNGVPRHICRGPGTAYHLVDVGPDKCRVVGAPITFSAASDLACAVLTGQRRAETTPGATRLLALAFLAAVAEAQRRRHREIEHRVSPGVQPANAAAPAPTPQPAGAAVLLAPSDSPAGSRPEGAPRPAAGSAPAESPGATKGCVA